MLQAITKTFALFLLTVGLLLSLALPSTAQEFRVEGAGLEADPVNYGGQCPGVIMFKGKIQASGAGRVKYTYFYSDRATGPEGTASTVPASGGFKATLSLAPPDPCTSLTFDSIQQIISAVGRSLEKAELDLASYRAGEIVDRARENRDDLIAARDRMIEFQTWLRNNYSSPYRSNNAAYTIFAVMNELVSSLNYARNQATLSFVYHHNVNARESFELTSQALDLAEPLATQAGRCYMMSADGTAGARETATTQRSWKEDLAGRAGSAASVRAGFWRPCRFAALRVGALRPHL